MVKVRVWFLVGDAVNVETFTAPHADTQIKPGGVGLVVLKDEDGRTVWAETFGTCYRIQTDERLDDGTV